MTRNKYYYMIKPLIPRYLQVAIRGYLARSKRKRYENIWPIDESAGAMPDAWPGWPGNKKFALILMHDIDTQKGHDTCLRLAEIDEKFGFRSTFNIVPEKYSVSPELIGELKRRGFGVGAHGLNHDGKLFSSERIFKQRAKRINYYLNAWESEGFSSPSMHHNLDWMHFLNIKYATSCFDTDPFEPQPDAAKIIFPFWAPRKSSKRYLEMPYTLPQDFTVFILLKERNIDIWKKKVNWIAEKGGMVLSNTHPDYMNFNKTRLKAEEYPVEFYKDLLIYIKEKYEEQIWHVLPGEVEKFWKNALPKD